MKSQQWLQLGVLSNKLSHINSHFFVRLNPSNESAEKTLLPRPLCLTRKGFRHRIIHTPLQCRIIRHHFTPEERVDNRHIISPLHIGHFIAREKRRIAVIIDRNVRFTLIIGRCNRIAVYRRYQR